MADDIKKIIEETAEKTAKKINDHFDVVAEDLKGEIKQVAEGVEANAQRLDRIETRVEKLEPLKDDVAAIKVAVGVVPGEKPLKQRVGILEERVDDLEAVSPTAAPMEEE